LPRCGGRITVACNEIAQEEGGVTSFKVIRSRAEKRKGGPKALEKLLNPPASAKALAKLGDDRVLAEMTRRVFCAGFAWSVIDAKWEGFEQAFLGFQPAKLTFKPDEFWEKLTGDTRIVRNGAKIMSVRDNGRFVQEIAREHGGFGKFLSVWPSSNEIGLLDAAALPRLGRLRHLARRHRLPARRRS
jgi:3-methyladenine DNA glycosylase Tag